MAKTNQAGIDLIKEFEGFESKAYRDGGGVWTIGYGHTRGVNAFTHAIDKAAAEELLRDDLKNAEGCVAKWITVPLTENQFSALVSLVFNCGDAPLRKTLGSKLNNEDYAGAADQILRWNKDNGKVVAGLTRRREAERELFLS